MKQTAVEWLVEQMIYQMATRIENTTIGCELFEQAKEMEKQQIIDAYKFGLSDEYVIGSEQYYNETYGVEATISKKEIVEISDEEIQKEKLKEK